MVEETLEETTSGKSTREWRVENRCSQSTVARHQSPVFQGASFHRQRSSRPTFVLFNWIMGATAYGTNKVTSSTAHPPHFLPFASRVSIHRLGLRGRGSACNCTTTTHARTYVVSPHLHVGRDSVIAVLANFGMQPALSRCILPRRYPAIAVLGFGPGAASEDPASSFAFALCSGFSMSQEMVQLNRRRKSRNILAALAAAPSRVGLDRSKRQGARWLANTCN